MGADNGMLVKPGGGEGYRGTDFITLSILQNP